MKVLSSQFDQLNRVIWTTVTENLELFPFGLIVRNEEALNLVYEVVVSIVDLYTNRAIASQGFFRLGP